jgi:hypothetical protein
LARQAALLASTIILLLFALLFGLLAAYHALSEVVGLSQIEAAGIVAACMLALALLVLAIMWLIERATHKHDSLVDAPNEALAFIDTGLVKATDWVGALPLFAIAFVAGLWQLSARTASKKPGP